MMTHGNGSLIVNEKFGCSFSKLQPDTYRTQKHTHATTHSVCDFIRNGNGTTKRQSSFTRAKVRAIQEGKSDDLGSTGG